MEKDRLLEILENIAQAFVKIYKDIDEVRFDLKNLKDIEKKRPITYYQETDDEGKELYKFLHKTRLGKCQCGRSIFLIK